MKGTTKISVNLERLIEVFDARKDEYKGHTTPIIGFIGEDLNAAIFRDYLIRRKKVKKCKILSYPVNTGQRRGPELDRWIIAGDTLYQTEIKSWCCFQIGGYKLPLESTKQQIKKLINKKWKRELGEHFNKSKEFGKVSKVLAKMKIPAGLIKKYKTAEPLVIHWMPISKNGTTPFFSHPVKNLGMNAKFAKQIQKNFTTVNYFSCSLYIRELIKKDKKKNLDLELPNVRVRMDIVKKLTK